MGIISSNQVETDRVNRTVPNPYEGTTELEESPSMVQRAMKGRFEIIESLAKEDN